MGDQRRPVSDPQQEHRTVLSPHRSLKTRPADPNYDPQPGGGSHHSSNSFLQTSQITEMYPAQFRYTKEHEWVHVEGEVGTMGITDHAQKELGDIVYVDLPKAGTAVEQGK